MLKSRLGGRAAAAGTHFDGDAIAFAGEKAISALSCYQDIS
jgi:hypothetical protein